MRHSTVISSLFILIVTMFPKYLHAIETKYPEGALLGFPEITKRNGSQLAEGKYEQWIESGKIQVKIRYAYSDGRMAEERFALEQEPKLQQESWAWKEWKGKKLIRRLEVDFKSKQAKAVKYEEKKGEKSEKEEWSEKLDDIEPGKTFAGTGMSFAVKHLMGRLIQGEKITLKSVAFTTKPRVTDVEIYRKSEVSVPVATQSTQAHHVVMHPKVPSIAKLIMNVEDLHLWISKTTPHSVVRYEGPLPEPGDPVVRVNVYPEVARTAVRKKIGSS